MNDQTAELLLQEFREFRADINSWKMETIERVTTLEAHDKDISGNGQPGRMTKVEGRITILERVHWRATGIVAAVACAISLLSRFIPLPWTHK